MFSTLVLFTFLIVVSTSTGAPSEAPSKGLSSRKTVELGKVIDIRGTNIFGDFQERQRTIFEPFDSKCFIDEKQKIQSSRKFMEYYENSNTFYSSLAT